MADWMEQMAQRVIEENRITTCDIWENDFPQPRIDIHPLVLTHIVKDVLELDAFSFATLYEMICNHRVLTAEQQNQLTQLFVAHRQHDPAVITVAVGLLHTITRLVPMPAIVKV